MGEFVVSKTRLLRLFCSQKVLYLHLTFSVNDQGGILMCTPEVAAGADAGEPKGAGKYMMEVSVKRGDGDLSSSG